MAYADRKFRLSKQDVAKLSKWAAPKPDAAAEKAKITQQRRDLWDAINSFVTERGGFIVSVKYASPMRMECDPESKLPEKLREADHDPVFLQQETRLGAPISTREGWRTNLNNGYSFHVRNVYELRLPK
jgi:hypothetical protein